MANELSFKVLIAIPGKRPVVSTVRNVASMEAAVKHLQGIYPKAQVSAYEPSILAAQAISATQKPSNGKE